MTAILQLPVIDRPLDNTALTLYMSCPRKYDFAMRKHRRSKGLPSAAIAYGSSWHVALEWHYKTNGDEAVVFEKAARSWQNHGREDDHRTFDRLWAEYGNYRLKYGLPEEEEAKTVGYPDAPAIEISANVLFPGISHPYAGKIDRIIELSGQYYIEDHKTTSRMGKYYFKEFQLSSQMQGYVCIGQELMPSIQIAGVRINAHAIYKRESKFERQIITFSKDRLDDWKRQYAIWVEKLERSYESNIFQANYNACPGRFGMCQYSEVCSMPPRYRDAILEQDFAYDPWNPLEAEDEEEVEALV